jgi:uncharacterized protein
LIRRFALRFIDTYQRRVAADLGTSCPFEPTCSEYGRLAFEKHGSVTATRLTIARLRRCRPGYTGPLIDYP